MVVIREEEKETVKSSSSTEKQRPAEFFRPPRPATATGSRHQGHPANCVIENFSIH